MNRTKGLVVASLALLTITAAPPAVSAPKAKATKTKAAVTFKLGTLALRDSSFHKILVKMGAQWAQATDGGVALKIFPGGAIGGEADMVRKMKIGQLHAGLLTVVGLSEIDDSVYALPNLPMMFRSLDEVDYIGEKLHPRVEKKLRDKGFIVLFWVDAGWIRFFSKQPVVHPDDLRKTKLFTWAGDPTAVDALKKSGFNPIPLETNDILSSLQTGLITAVPAPPQIALLTQIYGPAPYMLELNWAPLVGGLVIVEREWNKLDPEAKLALAKAASEAGVQMKAQNRLESDQAVVQMQKRKLKVQKVTPAVEAEWRKAAEAAYPRLRSGIASNELLDEVARLLRDYRSGTR